MWRSYDDYIPNVKLFVPRSSRIRSHHIPLTLFTLHFMGTIQLFNFESVYSNP